MKSCGKTDKNISRLNTVLTAKLKRANETVVFGELALCVLAYTLYRVTEKLIAEALKGFSSVAPKTVNINADMCPSNV